MPLIGGTGAGQTVLTKVEISNTTHWGYGGWANSVNKSGNIKYHSLGVRGLGKQC